MKEYTGLRYTPIYEGNFVPNQPYQNLTIVTDGTSLYISKQPTNGEALDNTDYWMKIPSIPGPAGPAGPKGDTGEPGPEGPAGEDLSPPYLLISCSPTDTGTINGTNFVGVSKSTLYLRIANIDKLISWVNRTLMVPLNMSVTRVVTLIHVDSRVVSSSTVVTDITNPPNVITTTSDEAWENVTRIMLRFFGDSPNTSFFYPITVG